MWKITTSAAAIGLSLCLVAGAEAAPGGGGHVGGGGGGGAHFGGGGGGAMHFGGGGGGGMHMGGGAPHFGGGAPGGAMRMGGGGVPHFSAHAAPQMSGARFSGAHFNGGHVNGVSPRFAGRGAGPGRSAFHAAIHGQGNAANVSHNLSHDLSHNLSHVAPAGAVHPAALAGAHFAHANTFAGPRSFAANRQFAANGAFHGFWGHGWHWHHHLGWIGPLFWPYAYGDFFYYALWPGDYAYYDPIWIYGYPDIYQGIFSPYDYTDYVQGSGAPARMATLTQSMAQSCNDEADEVTGWPIDQISAAVQPSQDQVALLDDLGNAVVKASSVIKSHCPTAVSFTPTGRLDTMQQRLQGLAQAVDIVSEPLGKFYDSLSDEQKARFNAMKPPADKQAAPNAANNTATPTPKADCDASAMAWPTEQIEQAVQPNDTQRAKLDALQKAAADGADIIKAACPSETPSTPPARLAAAGKHLKAMLQAVEAIRVPLHDFYNSLSDNQKARFNTVGKQLFAQNQ